MTEHDGPQQGALAALGSSPAKSKQWSILASLGAIVSTLLSASCALGLVLTLLGLGGSAVLIGRALQPLAPYMTLVAVALLGAGFYFTHLKPRTGRCPGQGAVTEQKRGASRGAELLFWIAAGFAIFFLLLPHLA